MTGTTAAGTAATETRTLTARHVVVAAGHATRAIDGLPGEVRKAIRPVKGQILRLRHPGNLPHILTHTVRAIVQGHDLYLVPRTDGELVVGATQEERDDRDVTAGAVHDLLRDATTAVPAVSELIFAEAERRAAARAPATTAPSSAWPATAARSSRPATTATASCCRPSPPTRWPRCCAARTRTPPGSRSRPGRFRKITP